MKRLAGIIHKLKDLQLSPEVFFNPKNHECFILMENECLPAIQRLLF